MEIYAVGHSDIGRVKDQNEDAFLVDDTHRLYIVADGMGGHAAGEVASAMAVQEIQTQIHAASEIIARFDGTKPHREALLAIMETAVRDANRRIFEAAIADPTKRGMGTTAVVLLLTPKWGFLAHVGDSRIYLMRKGEMIQLTEDHSLVNELIKRGRIKPEEAKFAPYRNAVTRAVGIHEDVRVDTLDFEIASGDLFLLCSDGLVEHVSTHDELIEVLVSQELLAAPRTFVEMANQRGGKDNITALVVRVGEAATPGDDIGIKLNALREMPLFQHLTYVELVEVLNVSEVKRYEASSPIFAEGDVGECMYVVLEGQVVIYKGDIELVRLGTGGHFGEMSIMDKSTRSASAEAIMPSRVISVGRKQLFRLMRRDKEIAVKLLWCFVQVLNQRLRNTSDDLREARAEIELSDFLVEESDEPIQSAG